jgi:hypothetical protein
MKSLFAIVMLVVLGTSAAWAGGGDYFSGPGRSPSYGPKAIAAGFGSGGTSSGSQQNAGSGSQTSSGGCGCCCSNAGHH